MLKYLNNENFKDLISTGLVLVDFYAEWCGPCKMLSPVLESLRDEDFDIIKVDIDKFEQLTDEYGVMSVPTMIIFKDGEKVQSLVGFKPKEEILKIIKEI